LAQDFSGSHLGRGPLLLNLGSLLARVGRVSLGIGTVGCGSDLCFAYMDIVAATKA
jgi:hypothetical protein